MGSTRIKICGVTSVADALAAAQAGADAIGLVFHEAAGRYVPLELAADIIAALPPFVTPVGLFVDAPLEAVRATADRLRLRHLQLHGNEEPSFLQALAGKVILKAIRVDRGVFVDQLAFWREAIGRLHLSQLRGFVLETPGSLPGGSGQANDWDFVRECQSKGMVEGLPPIIAAGGLSPANVGSVIASIRPWAVDVSSGVESTRGRKDHAKIEQFVAAVREADAAM